jgi:hypothetical protein
MEPPKWVLDKLEELHPICRLGAGGGLRPDEIGVLELWRVREAPTTVVGEPFLGRVFGSHYDPLERVPLLIMTAHIDEVYSGDVIGAVRLALTSFAERSKAAKIKQAAEEEEKLQEMAEDMGDRIWHESQQTGAARGNLVELSSITEMDKLIATGEWAAQNSRVTAAKNAEPAAGGAIK